MDSTRKKYLLNKANNLLISFKNLGVPPQGGDTLGNGITLENLKIWSLACVIREAALLEREGILIPDTNRMGKFVGWHITRN